MTSTNMLQRCVDDAICGFTGYPASSVDGNGWDQWKAEMQRGPSPSYGHWEEAVKCSCEEVVLALSVEQQRVLWAETDADLEPSEEDDDPRPGDHVWVEILSGKIYEAVCVRAGEEAAHEAYRLDGVPVFTEESWVTVAAAKRAARSLLTAESLSGTQIACLGRTLHLIESMPDWEVKKYMDSEWRVQKEKMVGPGIAVT